MMQENGGENTYTVTVSGEGLSVNQEVDGETALAVVNILIGGQRPDMSAGAGRSRGGHDTGATAERGRPVSLREFLDECDAKRNPDKITAIGEYMHENEGMAEFSRDDVRSRFKQAGESPPANYPRDFKWTVSNGWIAEDPNNSGAFYVTKKGHEAIGAKFAPEVIKGTRQKPSGRRRATKRDSGERRESGE